MRAGAADYASLRWTLGHRERILRGAVVHRLRSDQVSDIRHDSLTVSIGVCRLRSHVRAVDRRRLSVSDRYRKRAACDVRRAVDCGCAYREEGSRRRRTDGRAVTGYGWRGISNHRAALVVIVRLSDICRASHAEGDAVDFISADVTMSELRSLDSALIALQTVRVVAGVEGRAVRGNSQSRRVARRVDLGRA